MHASPLKRRITSLDQKINRLRDRKSRLSRVPQRAQRTRTLIQLGGLLLKSGWVDTFNIETGCDLQSIQHRDKAARLLGALLTLHKDLDVKQNASLFEALGYEELQALSVQEEQKP